MSTVTIAWYCYAACFFGLRGIIPRMIIMVRYSGREAAFLPPQRMSRIVAITEY
ncbi:hypothetical protein CLOBOL_03455 [Enterocloster bolteae ATCC BAA-613]|uniref:Uncharacterized protein n=1 Tax=Enterocloster bolteae (strain ATCC BAA-613 / DSM 15670 / CCUG 46953 / JCM 12243 / WAL 16351) TaxID=411902 RepID=A8RSV6_ENTBW|nr:hypothetical protein CLOBOL_03455 [Enterocloster bolteae ATCC BAA-613]